MSRFESTKPFFRGGSGGERGERGGVELFSDLPQRTVSPPFLSRSLTEITDEIPKRKKQEGEEEEEEETDL